MLSSNQKSISKTNVQVIDILGHIKVVKINDIIEILDSNQEEEIKLSLEKIALKYKEKIKEEIKLNKLNSEIKSLIGNYRKDYKIISIVELIREVCKSLAHNPNFIYMENIGIIFKGYSISLITSKTNIEKIIFKKSERIGRNLTKYDYDFLKEDLENNCLSIFRITEEYHKLINDYSRKSLKYTDLNDYVSNKERKYGLEIGDKNSLNYVEKIELELVDVKIERDSIKTILEIFNSL